MFPSAPQLSFFASPRGVKRKCGLVEKEATTQLDSAAKKHKSEEGDAKQDIKSLLQAIQPLAVLPVESFGKPANKFELQTLSERCKELQQRVWKDFKGAALAKVKLPVSKEYKSLKWADAIQAYMAAFERGALPTDTSLTYESTLVRAQISNKDPRGQHCLMTTCKIPRLSVACMYKGAMCCTWEVPRLVGLCHHRDWNVYGYSLTTEVENQMLVLSGVNGSADAFDFAAKYINDAKGLPNADTRYNVEWVEVLYKGWPYVFLVTTDDIPGKTELLAPYGERYWKQQAEEEAYHQLIRPVSECLAKLS